MYNNEGTETRDSGEFALHSSKKSKKSKSKKRKTSKKEKKKYKKKRKYSTSSSSSESSGSDTLEWVEKSTVKQTLSTTENLTNNDVQEKQSKRDEWMNLDSFFPCTSKSDMKKQKSEETKEDQTKILLNNPGQSEKELNVYWKDGGNGLPPSSLEKSGNQSILDVNWLKKSLRRAEEQALRDGKSLEEVAAERWGSLEAIQSMIAKAERIANTDQDRFHQKRSYSDRSKNNSWRTSNSRTRNHSKSRSRSRSRSRERTRKYNTHSLSQSRGQKKMYQRPKEDDDYYQQAERVSNSSRVKSWKKDKGDDRKCEPKLSSSELKNINVEEINHEKEVHENNDKTGVLSEAEMNKLGARIVKAEIMGDEQLAAQLKTQLEQARKLAATNKAVAQEETVILTRTDEKGITRPVQPRSQPTENRRKKKITETHVSGERMRHFADDDKYSLHEMFQREKGRSANEDEAMFTKLASKGMDMDEMFEQQIAQTNLGAKDDMRDRTRAIKEHKNLSKSLDNCWWCLDSTKMLKHMVVTMDSMVCLNLPACTSLTTGHCILTPVQHVSCQLQLDEDVWESFRELKRKLMTMFAKEDLYPVFFEIYKKRRRFSHMQLECIPLPKDIGESAPMYFKKALLECEAEWSMNKKVIDLKDKGIRHAVPNGLSYFMIEFASHPGYAHVIEDEELFPKNFAEEIIGGMLDLDCNLWRKPRKLKFDEQRVKVLEFTKMWKKYNFSKAEDI